MSVTGAPGGGPMRVGIPVADLTAGLFGAIGILTALLERDVSGEGQLGADLAAPSAGLHNSKNVLERLRLFGVN